MNEKVFRRRFLAALAALPDDQREAFIAMWEEDADMVINCIRVQGDRGRFFDFPSLQKHFRIARLLQEAATTTQ